MKKDLRCRLNLQHRYVRRYAHDADGTGSHGYLECKRCGKFRDLPIRPVGAYFGM